MTDDVPTDEQQAEDDKLALIVAALEEAGLAEVYEQPDGTTAVRLTQRGEELRQELPEVVDDDPTQGDV